MTPGACGPSGRRDLPTPASPSWLNCACAPPQFALPSWSAFPTRRVKMTETIQKWKIAGLKPHPLQAQFFADLPMQKLRDLTEDMKERGQKEPLELLPDGTIVCGHQRAKAAETVLGWDEIDAWVNHDLADQGDLAVEQRLIEDNLARRQLDRLDQVRCY